ncbi:MAG: isoprenoid biosynthesis glyoxalase ElbB [Candidatus Marinimicrobia bacterium]|nr:isoprenoid biosynthesis glyoxalase ElbB [Candidatus Neomarinimicrobiota bacterium]MBL7023376.1 isoprenoid biosynthesis glyoxalase ElbB [Candidatus Neomarinimicrobiota bacterium]MBL7109743.1 isoprenoid biosynthesis glyoxalase ElbB [Candidatus Neomarinimicrobiota bacterium]
MKIGVCLAGCGVMDGSEIHESVITILALDRLGVEIIFMAPDVNQLKVVNHLDASNLNENRNVRVESGRIARGSVMDIAEVSSNNIDALIFPGGFGAALNLCDFGISGPNCNIHSEVKRIVQEMIQSKKPIGAICIAPAMLAKAIEDLNLNAKLTIGTDSGTASAIESMGSKHINCSVTDCVVDETNKIVTTPAYMLSENISEVATGIEKLVTKIIQFV